MTYTLDFQILQVFPNGCEKVCTSSHPVQKCWQFLKIDPDVPCYEYTHIVSLVLACMALVYVIGVPVVLTYLIWKSTRADKVTKTTQVAQE